MEEVCLSSRLATGHRPSLVAPRVLLRSGTRYPIRYNRAHEAGTILEGYVALSIMFRVRQRMYAISLFPFFCVCTVLAPKWE